jgi:NAD(P)H-hydrate epimerase
LSPSEKLAGSDLVVDAAYGTGLSRPFQPADPGATPVLAVDIPSGLSGLTGTGESMTAERTVTFAAYKPGLLLGEGLLRCGSLELAGIGLESLAGAAASTWLLDESDLAALTPRARFAHKWNSAVIVVGGSPAMMGAPLACSQAAMRAGAGYALVGVPGSSIRAGVAPGEQVWVALDGEEWVDEARVAATRTKAIVVGPGLGASAVGRARSPGPASLVGEFLATTEAPAVVDADALGALGSLEGVLGVARSRSKAMVLTPHDGEYQRLSGHPPRPDRVAEARDAARRSASVVLLKGPTTVVAAPDGRVALCAAGPTSLATAGSGDVLSGIVAAFLARGLEPWLAASLAAQVHGLAARLGPSEGLIASDLAPLVSQVLSRHALDSSGRAKPSDTPLDPR